MPAVAWGVRERWAQQHNNIPQLPLSRSAAFALQTIDTQSIFLSTRNMDCTLEGRRGKQWPRGGEEKAHKQCVWMLRVETRRSLLAIRESKDLQRQLSGSWLAAIPHRPRNRQLASEALEQD